MTIRTESKTIDKLFKVKYDIDFYQRDYRWEREHVETLLDDIFFRFEADYNPDEDATVETVSTYAWYYLSTFVTNSQDGHTFIVDGQQRLTTITLILIKLYHLARAHGNDHLQEWLKDHIRGTGPTGPTFWMGTGIRQEALRQLYEGDGAPDTDAEAVEDLTARNIYQNYSIVSETLDEQLDTARRCAAFTLYFMMRIELVELDITDSRDVAMVFEVINDRGEKLHPYEVFKGELLGQLTKREVEGTYLRIWDDAINPLQNRRYANPDTFFRLLFRSRYTDGITDYRSFAGGYQRVVLSDKWDPVLHLKRNPERVKTFLREEVAWYAPLYAQLVKLARRGGMGDYAYFNGRLNRLDRQVLLVLSAVAPGDPDRDAKIRLVTRLFDRHYTLLHLTRSFSSNAFDQTTIALNTTIRDAGLDAIQAAFDARLLEDISATQGVEIDDPFQWSLFRDVGYRLPTRFLRYFFARLHTFIWEGANLEGADLYRRMVLSSPSRGGYHVEHILANNAENLALFGGDEDAFLRERNRLGGLVLLKGRDNVASSNETYADKLKTYAHGPVLAQTLTPDFYHHNPDFADFAERHRLDFRPITFFDGAAIEERHRLYFEMTKIIWGDGSFPLT